MQMKFEPQGETDFLKNEYFVRWVLSPTRDSSAYWQRWSEQHPDKVEMLGAARDLLLSFDLRDQHEMDDPTYYRILDNLLQANGDENRKDAQATPRSWLFAAASIIILCSLCLAGFYFLNREDPRPLPEAPVVAYQQETIPAGFKKTVTLPDGSVVMLNSSSELKYPDQFADTLREVFLTGQAFFEVTRNAHAPFIVRTQHFSTRVLGTSFDIRSYENEKDNHVAVLTGKVHVKTPDGMSQLLSPKEQAAYNAGNKTLKKSAFDPALLLAWREGVIAFDGAGFEEVKTYLERWYAVEFIVKKGFEVKGLYTGRFEKNESLMTVLKGISYSSHFSFRVAGRKVFIDQPKTSTQP